MEKQLGSNLSTQEILTNFSGFNEFSTDTLLRDIYIKTNEESKGLEFNNYLNELRKDIKLSAEANGKTVWTKGFDEIFKENERQRMLADYGISQKEFQEASNDKEIAMRLSDALDEIANGKIAVFGKMVEEAKQAKNETAIQKWQFEQDRALSHLINELGGDGKYGKLITGIISAIFNKWHGFGKSKKQNYVSVYKIHNK